MPPPPGLAAATAAGICRVLSLCDALAACCVFVPRRLPLCQPLCYVNLVSSSAASLSWWPAGSSFFVFFVLFFALDYLPAWYCVLLMAADGTELLLAGC